MTGKILFSHEGAARRTRSTERARLFTRGRCSFPIRRTIPPGRLRIRSPSRVKSPRSSGGSTGSFR